MAAIDPATNAANLGSASNLVAINLGLDGVPASSWSQDQRISFITGLSNTILQYPQSFSDASIASAQSVLGQNMNGMTLDDFVSSSPDGSATLQSAFVDTLADSVLSTGASIASIGTGAAALLNNLGSAVGNISTGVANASNLSSWLVPVAAVAFVALFVMNSEKKVRSYAGG